ncbi:hypothetical protein Aperf_G00000090868 [Anoplocephala perfoliata]
MMVYKRLKQGNSEIQRSMGEFLYNFVICEKLTFLGYLDVLSSGDSTEIHNALVQLVNEGDAHLSSDSSPSNSIVSISFPTADKSTEFSIFDSETGEIFKTFDASKVSYCESKWIKDTRGFLVFTYPKESSDFSRSTLKPQYCCYAYQCSSIFESTRAVACINALNRRTALSTNSTTSNSTITASNIPTMPQWMTSKILSQPTEYRICLRLHIDIREADTKSSLGSTSVPKERPNLFKFRRNQDKILVIGVSQPEESSDVPPVRVVRCQSIGLTYGRFVSPNDITELISNAGPLPDDEASVLIPEASIFVTKAPWSPRASQFADLNTVTDRDRFVFFTVVCDLLLESLTEPIRLGCVCRAKIFEKDLALWLPAPRKACSEDFKMKLVELTDEDKRWIIMNRFSLTSMSSSFSEVIQSLCPPQTGVSPKPTSLTAKDSEPVTDDTVSATVDPEEDGTDDDEPLMSGNGGEDLRKNTDDDASVSWGNLVTEWRGWIQNSSSSTGTLSLPPHPSAEVVLTRSGAEALPDGTLGRRLRRLIRQGIPETLRPEIWQNLAGHQTTDQGLMEVYRILLTKPCQFDSAIQRDLPRTLPASNFFQERSGQEVLFQLTRAYALYDEAVGYCQGISFVAAALLLHLPEEQAFCLLVKIMSNYGARLLFLNNCEGLFRCLYQLERLLEDQLPDVSRAFSDLGVKAHMYASQWFLTLFAAKFPLNFVFRIFDVFLAEGFLFIFKVMISFLRVSRNRLLGLDFEGTLKYFRITLPKRFRSAEACDELIKMACSAKVTGKQLNKYAREFEKQREADAKENSPLTAMQREIQRLRDEHNRLDKENDDLAESLLSKETTLQARIEKLENEVETLTQELKNTSHELTEKEEECSLLERDSVKVKSMFRDALAKDEEQKTIIAEYKTITANLSQKLEEASAQIKMASSENSVSQKLSQTVVEAVLACNGDCRKFLDEYSPGWSSQSACVISNGDEIEELEGLRNRVKELEIELAHNKVKCVDAECLSQELKHQLMQKTAELDELRASTEAAFGYNARQWLAKKWTTVSSRANATSSTPPPSSAEGTPSGSTLVESSAVN